MPTKGTPLFGNEPEKPAFIIVITDKVLMTVNTIVALSVSFVCAHFVDVKDGGFLDFWVAVVCLATLGGGFVGAIKLMYMSGMLPDEQRRIRASSSLS